MESSSLSLGLAFLGGVAASVTPCVYPLIPVTLAIFGATRDTRRLRAFLLSLSYVAGIAVSYTVLGLISAATGSLLGEALRNPIVVVVLAIFFVVLALYSIDIVQFEGAYRLQNKASLVGGKGFSGAFLMGAVSGIVAAPCAGPLLVAILSLAAASKSMWWSAALLLSYSLGFGLIFLLLGTFSGLLRRLPRSGDWFYIIKLLIAAALLLYAISLVAPLFGITRSGLPSVSWLTVGIIFAVTAVVTAYRFSRPIVRLIAALIIAGVLIPLVIPSVSTWHPAIEAALDEARSSKEPIMVDFFAEWCAACKEFDQLTFPDPRVASAFQKFVLARIDMTVTHQQADELTARYEILGLPTLLFLCPDGKEIPATRVEGFKPPMEFVAHLSMVQEKAKLCGTKQSN